MPALSAWPYSIVSPATSNSADRGSSSHWVTSTFAIVKPTALKSCHTAKPAMTPSATARTVRVVSRSTRSRFGAVEVAPADWRASRPDRLASLGQTGVPRSRLRSDPSNLIRFVPAKGVRDRSTLPDDRHVRLGRRRRHPGRPEGVRRRRRARSVGARCAHRAEHHGGHGGADAAARVRPRSARRVLRRHRRRRREDRDALLPAADRDGRGRPRRAGRAARRRPGHGRELRREAPAGRRRRGARRPAVPARDRRDAEPARGGGAHRRARVPRAPSSPGDSSTSAPPRPSSRAATARRPSTTSSTGASTSRYRSSGTDVGRHARCGLHALGDALRGPRSRAVAGRGGAGRGVRGRPRRCARARRARRGRRARQRPRRREGGVSVDPGATLAVIRERRPLVHQITNFVVMNETANATLALGALPVMAHAREEVEEMAASPPRSCSTSARSPRTGWTRWCSPAQPPRSAASRSCSTRSAPARRGTARRRRSGSSTRWT